MLIKLKKLVRHDDSERGGFLLLDKEKGITSFKLISRMRKKLNVKRIGHSGTLDPLASGLMLLAVGRATRFLEYLIGCDKEYEVWAQFGAVSETLDAEGEIREVSSRMLEKAFVLKKIESEFVGNIKQVPPKYSALKINGKRACDLVRSGVDVEMKERDAQIYQFEYLEGEYPLMKFRVKCASGTYIRTLIADLGQSLGVGAYVQELRRTMIDNFTLSDVSEDLQDYDLLLRKYQAVELKAEQYQNVIFGQEFEVENEGLAVFEGKVVGILRRKEKGRLELRGEKLELCKVKRQKSDVTTQFDTPNV